MEQCLVNKFGDLQVESIQRETELKPDCIKWLRKFKDGGIKLCTCN